MEKSSAATQMFAVGVFPKKKEIKVLTVKTPRITSPNHVLLRILEVGICGTDREIASFEYGTPPEDSDYLVIGHEALGEVVRVGKSVTRVEPGDLAVITVRRPCSHKNCRPCRAGYPDFCITDD
jgi:glucose 1-dehydrogenase